MANEYTLTLCSVAEAVALGHNDVADMANADATIAIFEWPEFVGGLWAERMETFHYCATVGNESEVFETADECAAWLKERAANILSPRN